MSIPIERSMILGVALAGGQSRRMGFDKALAPLGGRPMLSAVIERLQGQVGQVVISAGSDPARFAQFHYSCLPDPKAYLGMGPAAGVLAGLRHARENGFGLVATVPCDAPFAPADWVARLVQALTTGIDVCAAESARGVEAAFAVWRVETATAVESALAEDERSLGKVMERIRAARVRFEPAGVGEVDAFWNVNQPADLALANDWVGRRPRRPAGKAQ